jgi:hypothetical protein
MKENACRKGGTDLLRSIARSLARSLARAVDNSAVVLSLTRIRDA